jgi:hypothetical protein
LSRAFKAYQYDKTVSITPPQYQGGIYWLRLERDGERMVKKIVLIK